MLKMTISQKLENFGFFSLIKKSDKLNAYKNIIDKNFAENQWLFLPNNDILTIYDPSIKADMDISTVDFRTVEIEGTSMYRGNLMSYLEDIKILFNKRNLKFQLGEEDMDWDEKTNENHPFKHTVNINGKDIIFFDGNLEDRNANNPQIYIENTIRILNKELELLESDERFFMLTGRECVYYILTDKKMLADFKLIKSEMENKILEF